MSKRGTVEELTKKRNTLDEEEIKTKKPLKEESEKPLNEESEKPPKKRSTLGGEETKKPLLEEESGKPEKKRNTLDEEIKTKKPIQKSPIKQLLGIGNPLLDISVKVDQAFLDQYNKKVDKAYLACDTDLPIYDQIVTFPEVVYIAGGSTQNTIRGAQWISPEPGVTHFIGSIGNDQNGRQLQKVAQEDGVKTHYYISKTHRTGCCAVLILHRERCLIADLAAANDYQHSHFESPEIQQLIENVDLFYSAGFFLTVSPKTVVQLGEYCATKNKILVWGVAAQFIVESFWDKVKEVLPFVDFLVANKKEAASFVKKLGFSEEDGDEVVLRKISELPKANTKRSRTVIVTRGEESVHIYHEGTYISIPVHPLPKESIVDTNGAGDAFLGGFLAGLMQDKPLADCVSAAIFTARHILQVSGTQYPKQCLYQWE